MKTKREVHCRPFLAHPEPLQFGIFSDNLWLAWRLINHFRSKRMGGGGPGGASELKLHHDSWGESTLQSKQSDFHCRWSHPDLAWPTNVAHIFSMYVISQCEAPVSVKMAESGQNLGQSPATFLLKSDVMSHWPYYWCRSIKSSTPFHYTNQNAQVAFTLELLGWLPHSLVCDA
jgi:hypothetical protein